ncbi:MAG: hypothetical protein NXI32_28725, partial [bacterium]|nr:hypothetical protein [bacterium]
RGWLVVVDGLAAWHPTRRCARQAERTFMSRLPNGIVGAELAAGGAWVVEFGVLAPSGLGVGRGWLVVVDGLAAWHPARRSTRQVERTGGSHGMEEANQVTCPTTSSFMAESIIARSHSASGTYFGWMKVLVRTACRVVRGLVNWLRVVRGWRGWCAGAFRVECWVWLVGSG